MRDQGGKKPSKPHRHSLSLSTHPDRPPLTYGLTIFQAAGGSDLDMVGEREGCFEMD
jgi:hypothetical protein